ncbi:hypothetical protein [Candidatus Oscillochloris fontis]|uniref:hypothetical protein n=1 Tax=Candidatus Oscillochloris fontis TaxID=2496868 RepID=UPI00101C895D|nr:hypothetical protein [Candidatus Oscillochloris fontis]
MTQGNLLILHRKLVDLPEAQNQQHLRSALECGLRAFNIFAQMGHQHYLEQTVGLLREFRHDHGDHFDALWAELVAAPLPTWLADQPEAPEPTLSDLQDRLAAAGVTNAESLQHALEADPELARAYSDFLAAHPELLMRSLIETLLQVEDNQAMVAFWQQLPAELEDPLLSAAEALLAQAQHAGEDDLVAALGPRLAGLRHICAAQRAQHPPGDGG